jgi:hypothetical protein
MQNFEVVAGQFVCDGNASDGLHGNTVMNRADKCSLRRLMNTKNVRWSRNLHEPGNIIPGSRDSEAFPQTGCCCGLRLKKEKRPFTWHCSKFDVIFDYWSLVSQMREVKQRCGKTRVFRHAKLNDIFAALAYDISQVLLQRSHSMLSGAMLNLKG